MTVRRDTRRGERWRRGRHAAGCSPSNRMHSVANRPLLCTTPDRRRQPAVDPDEGASADHYPVVPRDKSIIFGAELQHQPPTEGDEHGHP